MADETIWQQLRTQVHLARLIWAGEVSDAERSVQALRLAQADAMERAADQGEKLDRQLAAVQFPSGVLPAFHRTAPIISHCEAGNCRRRFRNPHSDTQATSSKIADEGNRTLAKPGSRSGLREIRNRRLDRPKMRGAARAV